MLLRMRIWTSITIGIIAALCCAAALYVVLLFLGDTYAVTADEPAPAPVSDDPEIARTRIQFVGDIMLARDVERLMGLYGSSYPYTHIADALDAPYVVGNFEAAVPEVHEPTPSMTMRFSVSEQHLAALQEAGVTHVSLANNHAYDHGNAGYLHSLRALERAGVEPFGHPHELGNVSVSFLALDPVEVAVIGIYAVVSVPSEAELAALVKEASARSDMQIAYLHWGDEYELVHNANQERLAHALADLGIDVVIGHHPHVVQDIELYNGTPIFYSLGNFIFDQYFSTDVQQGLMLDLAVSNDGSYTVSLVPVTTEASRTAPRLMTGHERDTFLAALAKRSTPALAAGIERGLLSLE